MNNVGSHKVAEFPTMGVTMTVKNIAHMDWTVTSLPNGERVYMNTTEGITGVAVIGEPGKFSYVIMVEGETSPRYMYDNTEFSDWSIPRTWGILESLGENMYDVEQDMIEESYDHLYEIGDRYEDYDFDYGYDNDSDLYNEH